MESVSLPPKAGDIATHLRCRGNVFTKAGQGALQSPVTASWIHKCRQHNVQCFGLFEARPQRDNYVPKAATAPCRTWMGSSWETHITNGTVAGFTQLRPPEHQHHERRESS